MERVISGRYQFFWLFSILSLIPAGQLHSQVNPQLQFDEATEYLQSGNYSQALSIYESLENQNMVSGSLYLNKAICYVRIDSLGMAKYNFLKAQRFEETRTRADQGLAFVESRFSRQSAVLPKLPWERFFDWLSETLGSTVLLLAGILLLNTGAGFFIAAWFMGKGRKSFRISGMTMAALGLIVILSSFYVQYLQNRYSPAVMVQRQTSVMEEPGDNTPVVSQAYEGYTLTVDHGSSEEYEGWSYVRMSNGIYGWIPDSTIMVL